MSKSRFRFTLLGVIGAAALALALFASSAAAKEPAAGYTQFKGCPSPEEASSIEICVRSEITGGHLHMGNREVPIEKPLELSGGTNGELEGFLANSKGGLTKVKEKIPGGVIGLTGLTWLLEFFGSEALTLYGITELAGPPTGFNFESVTIPIKVHLENPGGLIGSTCYVGSNSEPITLHLITGTTNPPAPNKPITGKEPEFSVGADEILHLNNGIFVDNSFAVPGANGCKLVLFGFIPISINGLVNETAGLPAAAGTNEAVQDFNLELVESRFVYP